MSINNNGKTYLLCGVALALFGGFASYTAIDKIQDMKPIVVATQNIPPRTQITDKMVKTIEVPSGARQENSIDDPSLIVGGYSTTRIFVDQPIIQPQVVKQFDENGASGLALSIPSEDLRAVSFPTSNEAAVNGKIKKGDYVDIVVTLSSSAMGANTGITKTILQGVEVFDTSNTGKDGESSGDITNITLLLRPDMIEVVKHAYSLGEVSYTLNPGISTPPVNTPGVINKSFCERFGFSCSSPAK